MKILDKIDKISEETPVFANYRGKQVFWDAPDKLTTLKSLQTVPLKDIQHSFFGRYGYYEKDLSFTVNHKEMSLEEFKTFLIHNGFHKE